jgi:hypothetical protein
MNICPRALAGVSLLFTLVPAAPVRAQQCPDGTPPPCAERPPAPHPPSVAILFMEPRSRNAADSLLAEGLTLEIINTLGGFENPAFDPYRQHFAYLALRRRMGLEP